MGVDASAASLQQAPYRPLSNTQRRALAWMEVTLYERRRLPDSQSAQTVAQSACWHSSELDSVLAKAIAKAVGHSDPLVFLQACSQWQLPLPALDLLRRDGASKRALWRQLRRYARPAVGS